MKLTIGQLKQLIKEQVEETKELDTGRSKDWQEEFPEITKALAELVKVCFDAHKSDPESGKKAVFEAYHLVSSELTKAFNKCGS